MSKTPHIVDSEKPRFRIVAELPVEVSGPETRLAAARRRYGKPFGVLAWPTGEGASYWTSERVARLAAANDEIRTRRQKGPR